MGKMNIMRYLFIALAATLLGLGGCGTADTSSDTTASTLHKPPEQVSATDAAWQEFTSAPGNFAVLMPGVPEAKKESMSTETGPIDQDTFTLRAQQGSDKAAYMISYADYPAGSTQKFNPNDFLEKCWQGGYSNLGDKLIYKKTFVFNGFAGLEFQYRGNTRPPFLITERDYLVHDRVYQMSAVMSQSQAARGDAQKYLDSFRLLK